MYKLTFYFPLNVYNHPSKSFLNCNSTCFLVTFTDKKREGNRWSNRRHSLPCKAKPISGRAPLKLFLGLAGPPQGGKCHQFHIYLCTYQAVSQGSANSDITGLVQEVGKTHKAGLGQLHTGQLQRRTQAATISGDPAIALVPENVQLSLELSVHLPANATTVCSSGSEQADALGVWPPLCQYEGLWESKKGKSSISG